MYDFLDLSIFTRLAEEEPPAYAQRHHDQKHRRHAAADKRRLAGRVPPLLQQVLHAVLRDLRALRADFSEFQNTNIKCR